MNWQKTGLIALRELGLSAVPDEALVGCEHAKLLDLTGNSLTALPASISSLTRLQVSSCWLHYRLVGLIDAWIPSLVCQLIE